jgi:SanA protein
MNLIKKFKNHTKKTRKIVKKIERKFIKALKNPQKVFLLFLLSLFILIAPFTFFWIQYKTLDNTLKEKRAAIVLGAGIRGKNPSPVLADRLDASFELWQKDKIEFIFVTGDNRYVDYNEPNVMANYLISRGFPNDKIIRDYGGRRTLDSCWRAKNIFNIDQAYIVTNEFHQPRALFLCGSLGIKSIAYSADNNYRDVTRWGYMREIPASWNAVFDIVLRREAEIKADGNEQSLM